MEYICSNCGATNIKPYDNGDGKHRCKKCAIEFYYANRFSLLKQRTPDAGDSASFLDLFYPIFNLLNRARRNPPFQAGNANR